MLFKSFMAFQAAMIRMTHGKLMAFMGGMPVLNLTASGRKTGQSRPNREIPVMALTPDE